MKERLSIRSGLLLLFLKTPLATASNTYSANLRGEKNSATIARKGGNNHEINNLNSMSITNEYQDDEHRNLWSFTSTCTFGLPDLDIFVSSTFGQDSNGYGYSTDTPYASIQYAVDNRQPCQTIYIMEGIYRNKNYDLSDNNDAVVSLNGVSDLKITNYGEDCVIIQFDGAGGFVGGGMSNPVTNLEISGVEIIGPNEQISYNEAYANRLLERQRYKGRGIAIWAGHHIYIHDVVVHHCPASGIRVNRGDYVTIENSEVYSNTWWSSAAESAIVFAQSSSIDESNAKKMLITRNSVYDNINKIPYYNKNYDWNYSPIGNFDCSSYSTCEDGLIENCPWQCRYGKETQDYIIDGSGVYVTRNNDSYLYGSFELSYNICFGNGINGLVFHRTDRAMIKQNIIFENGVVPILDKPEPIPQDWHEGCSGKSRQPYSGLVLNNANDVKLWSNKVTARYEDDYAFIQLTDNGIPSPISAGGNNKACNGLLSINPSSIVKFNPDLSICLPDIDISINSMKHACRQNINYKEINCGENCHFLQLPCTMQASYKSSEARDKCANDCEINDDCKAFSLQSDILQNRNRLCILYIESEEPTRESCELDYQVVHGQLFIDYRELESFTLNGHIC